MQYIIIIIYATTVRSTGGLKEHMQMLKTFLWSFSNAGIVK
jgi:hypothetical protein